LFIDVRWDFLYIMVDAPSVMLAFIGGLLSVTSPCVLPLLPVVMAGSVGHRLRPLAIVLGMSLSFSIMGGVVSAVGFFSPLQGQVMRNLAIALIIIFGLFLASESLNNYFVMKSSLAVDRLRQLFKKDQGGMGTQGPFILGMSLGIAWIPCVGPVLGAILMYVTIGGQVLHGSFLLFVYSMGLGLPMLAVAYAGKYTSGRLTAISQRSHSLKKAAGIILIIMGISMLLGLDRTAQIYIAPYLPTIEFIG
jgi:cytochrome c biogenesis protein CcdA